MATTTTSKAKPRTSSKPAVTKPSSRAPAVIEQPPVTATLATVDEFRTEAPEMLSNSEVYDEADQAQWIQLAEQASFRERARVANAPETHPDFDGKHCLDCGEEIPEGRLLLAKIRCVECQRALELKRRQFA